MVRQPASDTGQGPPGGISAPVYARLPREPGPDVFGILSSLGLP